MGQLETGYLEKETGIACCTLMFHNAYGTPTDFGARSQVIPALIRKAIRYPEEEFLVWGSGNQGRAFIHVNDIVEALVLALDKGWGHGWIQIGPDYSTSIREIAYKVAEISGKDLTPVFSGNYRTYGCLPEEKKSDYMRHRNLPHDPRGVRAGGFFHARDTGKRNDRPDRCPRHHFRKREREGRRNVRRMLICCNRRDASC